MGKPLSRPGCFRKSSCCLEKHGAGDGVVGGRAVTVDGGYGDGYVPQRSIYDTMCINQQIDSHHHHSGGSIRRDGGNEGNFSYSASGSLRVSRSPADMFDSQPRSLTPNPSFVRRLDERAIYDSLKLGGQDVDGGGCHSPGCFNRSVSPSMSSFSAPGVSSSSSKKHHHHPHHQHGDSTKSRDGRHSWKVLTPPTHIECMEYTTTEMIDRGGGYLNPGQYPPPGGQSSSLTSPLISPFSGSPLSSGYHTPVFFSPAKPRPSQSQSLRCSPPHVIQPRHYSQTQSLRMSPPLELRRSPYRAPLVQLSAHDLEQDMRDRGGGWGRNDRERDWEREREREMERGWAQREWERERERGRLERERARERERRETSSFGTFGYGRPVPLRSDRDSVFLEPEQVLDTTPLLVPQPSPSPSPSPNAPRMGTGAVGRNRAGSKVGSESIGGGMVSKYDNGSVGLVLIDSKSGYGPRLVNEVGNMSEAEIRAAIKEHHRAESWNQHDHGSRSSVKNGSEKRMGSQVKTRPGGRDLEGKVQSGVGTENMGPTVNKEGHKGGTRSGERNGRVGAKPEPIAESTPYVTDIDNRIEPQNNFELVAEPGTGMKPEIEAEVEARDFPRKVDNPTGTVAGGVETVNNEVISPAGPRVEADVIPQVKSAPSEPEDVLQTGVIKETGSKSNSETGVACQTQSNKNTDKDQISVVTGDKSEAAPVEQVEKKPLDIDKIESTHVEKGSRSRKSKSSKSTSRTRPGTAIGIRPGVVSPCLSRGFPDLEPTSPAEGIESTWPRRIIVRKRTVRQGGALHNLPILPPLPSVLSALEKRHPHVHLLPRPGHFSENPLTTLMNATSIVGRCSLKEPSHQDPGQSASLVGRASLKEQNLEQWRVCREQEEPKRSRSKEKGKTDIEEKKVKEEKRDNEKGEEKDRKKEKVAKEKERVTVSVGLVEETKREKSERRVEEKAPEDGNIKERVKNERDIEIICEKKEDKGMKTKDGTQGRHVKEQVGTKSKKEESELKGGEEGGPLGEEEGWDTVLDMVNTLWEDGWEKGGAGGGDDTDSFSGSLPRWPLLRPPIGFGGSHPPSSAASELSLTELERRARELDSDLEHLDLSQPHRDTQDLYQPLLEAQRERADMYQTHPGPQRDKASVFPGTGSRAHVSLELTAMASPATDTERPSDWSTKTTGTSTAGPSSTKEDSSPDSNLTLESDSSGVFLSLSNQSQEEAGSDSDQPISGSDLGSSSTSLEKDGEDGGSKEWGREESAELQWCYPTLLNTSLQEDIDGDRDQEEAGHGKIGTYERGGKDDNIRRVGKIGTVSIMKTPLNYTDNEGSTTFTTPQCEEIPPRKRVSLMGGDIPLPLSPSRQPIKTFLDPNQKPIRSSGLDCGDIDPFVQSDSFVYLAVSAKPASQGEVTTTTEVPTHGIKQGSVQKRSNSVKTHFDQSNTEWRAKPTYLGPQKPEEGDFLCTDSFVYLAAPACHLLGPTGTAPYSGRESDSESSGSGPGDMSVLGCGSVAGDSDWDSDLSDSDPSRSSRISSTGNKAAGASRSKQLHAEPGWDLFGDTTEPEVLSELFMEQDKNNNGKARKVTGVTSSLEDTPTIPMATQRVNSPVKRSTTMEQASTKVTWQFRPAQRSVCTGSRKEKEKEMTSSSSVRFTELRGGETHRGSPSSSSSSSSSPSSSSSG
ncbi:hypothetical protein PBY51_010256 [Eleginops maclovinus]|uniref:Uncharacterized protein n=1 Tax=Eleginops maclovinus TaxID=56733 RepID=A0AAN7X645_ELEMC|nr:hypothetical protein PBY51_010256 [Eleginops maclovinus]